MGMEVFVAAAELCCRYRNLDFRRRIPERVQSGEAFDVSCDTSVVSKVTQIYFDVSRRPADVGVQSAKDFYFPTHIRCGSWLIGVMLAYIFHSTRHRKIAVNKVKF